MNTVIDPPTTNGTSAVNVRLPAGVVDPSGKDLAKPTADLLREVAVLETKADVQKGVSLTETPQSLQVITAGALGATKATAGLTATGGIGGAVATFWASFNAQEISLRISLIAAAAVILAAALLAVARIVASDVNGRAAASVAQYEARASIVASLYRLLERTPVRPDVAPTSAPMTELAAAGGALKDGAKDGGPDGGGPPDAATALLSAVSAYPTAVRMKGECTFVETNGLRYVGEGLQVRLLDGDWVGVGRVDQFRPA